MSKNKFSSSGFIRHLQGLIKNGYFPRDKKLPSVRQLAEQFGVGRQIAHFDQRQPQGILYQSGIFRQQILPYRIP